MNKILLTGTIHVGKTTLWERIRRSEIPGLVCLPELATDLMTHHSRIIQEHMVNGIIQPSFSPVYFNIQVNREIAAGRKASQIVCDRGIVDLITHTLMEGGSVNPAWLEHSRTYTKIFVFSSQGVPLDLSRYPQGRDWVDFRRKVEDKTLEFLNKEKFEFELLSGSVESKEAAVRAALGIDHSRARIA